MICTGPKSTYSTDPIKAKVYHIYIYIIVYGHMDILESEGNHPRRRYVKQPSDMKSSRESNESAHETLDRWAFRAFPAKALAIP